MARTHWQGKIVRVNSLINIRINTEIKADINKGTILGEELEAVKEVSDEIHEKYDKKNQIHQECLQRKEAAEKNLKKYDDEIAKIEKTMN